MSIGLNIAVVMVEPYLVASGHGGLRGMRSLEHFQAYRCQDKRDNSGESTQMVDSLSVGLRNSGVVASVWKPAGLGA